MDFTVSTRALVRICGANKLQSFKVMRSFPSDLQSRARLTPLSVDIARTVLRGPRPDVYHLYSSLDFALRLLQPMRDAAIRRPAFGLLI